VDRVVEIEYGKYAVGYKNITVNDQFFNGHFPERAIMPGWLGSGGVGPSLAASHASTAAVARAACCVPANSNSEA
jgi:3-hydroxymyristoyl/3-hydroxydecanoyl-(acyl carrier protein) dehydratase